MLRNEHAKFLLELYDPWVAPSSHLTQDAPVLRRYSLEQATEGFRALLTRKAMGKVLIEPASQSKL